MLKGIAIFAAGFCFGAVCHSIGIEERKKLQSETLYSTRNTIKDHILESDASILKDLMRRCKVSGRDYFESTHASFVEDTAKIDVLYQEFFAKPEE